MNAGVKWTSQVAKEVWNITWKYWGRRSAWTHSYKSLWYQVDSLNLQYEVKEEYQRGSEGYIGLAARWWRGPQEDVLATRVQNQERWLGSVRLGRKKADTKEKAARKQRQFFSIMGN